eukprot:COSAG02_NODE_2604_length_8443_cov_6.439593_10_plen_51_part_00
MLMMATMVLEIEELENPRDDSLDNDTMQSSTIMVGYRANETNGGLCGFGK